MKQIAWTISLWIVLSTTLIGQNNFDFTFEFDSPPTEVCDDKWTDFKIKSNNDFPCEFDGNIEWFIFDEFSNDWSKQICCDGKFFDYFVSFSPPQRTFRVKAQIRCTWPTGELDEDDNPITDSDVFDDIITVNIVDPDFFKLSVVGQLGCDATSFEFNLADPSGTLASGNLDNISWTIPSAWSAVSGLGTSNIVVNTNGSAAGSNKVEVKFDAIASKMNNVGQLIPKKCASSELEASFSITSCRSVINYPPSLVNHPSSHSDNKTSFGNISLPPNNYNFASGGEHTLKDNFDFKASGNSSLNIFIENCDCDSEWHDPNLMGQSSVQINNPVLNFNKKDERISRQPDSTNIGLESKVVLSNIYPNPFKGEVRITNLSIETLVTIKIFTGDGVKVFEKEVLADANGQIALRLAALRSGLFIAWVKQKDEVNTFKILKLD